MSCDDQRNTTASERPDAKHVFHEAERFRLAGVALTGSPLQPGEPPSPGPIVVCLALSLELFLKCLITLEGKDFRWVHAHTTLFGALSGDAQAAIRVIYKVRHERSSIDRAVAIAYPGTNFDFDHVLKLCENAFQISRYAFHAESPEARQWMSGRILDSVREYIIEHYPEAAAA